jgi:hypothetical protein
MKRYILLIMGIATLVTIVIANINAIKSNSTKISLLSLSNIEALSSESDSGKKSCYKETVADPNQNNPNSVAFKVIDCDDCPNTFWATSGSDSSKCD